MARLALNVFELSAVMAVVVCVLLVLKKPVGSRFSAFSRYLVWTLVILRLCVPVGAGFAGPWFTVTLPEKVTADAPVTDQVTLPSVEATEHVSAETVQGTTLTEAVTYESTPLESTPAEVVRPQETVTVDRPGVAVPEDPAVNEELPSQPRTVDTRAVLAVLGCVWLAGALSFFLFRMGAYTVFTIRMNRRLLPADDRVERIYTALCGELKIKRVPRLYVTREPVSPMLYGYFRPRIVVPDLEFTDEDKICAILVHELIHHRRGDLYVKLLCTVATAVHWFNPASHAAASRCISAMEIACDEAVIRELCESSREHYGETLLEIVHRCAGVRASGMTTGMNSRRGAVKERIMNILDTNKKKRGAAIVAAVLCLCIGAGGVVGCTVGDTGENEVPEKDSSVYYVPEYMKIVDSNDIYEVTLTFEGDKIIAERTKNGEADATYTALYDRERLTAVEVRDPSGELIRTKSLSYDESGNVTLISYTSADKSREYSRTEYVYEGELLKTVTYTEDDEPGRYKITYHYSEHGWLTREDRSRTMYSYRLDRVKYSHNDEGRITKTEFYSSDDGKKHNLYEMIENTEMDGDRVMTSILSYDMPEDYSSYLDVKRTNTYTYDSFGNVLTHRIDSEFEKYDADNMPNYGSLTNTYTKDGRYLTSQTVEGNYPYFESLLKEYSGRFDAEKLESSGFILQGTQIKWRGCDESEYLRYRSIYETVDTLSEQAECGYLLDIDNHMWCFDDVVTDMVNKAQPYEVFEGSDPLNEAEAREKWYIANLDTRESSTISYETLKLSLEAFLMGDYEVFASLQEGTPSAHLAYQGLKIGDYSISLNTTDDGVGVMLDFEVLESENDILTPGYHRFLTYWHLGTYLVRADNDETVPREYYDNEYHSRIHSALLNRLYEFDEDTLDSEEVNMAFTGYVRRYAAEWLKDNYPDLADERFSNISGSWKLTVDELKDYVKKYYGFENYEPFLDNDKSRLHHYTYRDGYIEYAGILGSTVVPSSIEHEQINDDGSVTITVTHWADMTRTVIGKRSRYTFATAEDGTTILREAELVYDSGIAPAYGNST